jgi:type II secretory pathway pseudopilin PulG
LGNWVIEKRTEGFPLLNYLITQLPNYQLRNFLMAPQFHRRRKVSREGGYILLTLLLVMALVAIFAGVVASSVTFQIKRDREEEMIHRGTQYSRAIRAYFKKFGRYPVKIEDLENSGNMRFLRKRYKDPLNCKPKCQDFKLLHYGEVPMAMGGFGGGTIPGANPVGAVAPNGPGGLPQSGGFGQNAGFGGSSGFGNNPSAPSGQNPQLANDSAGTDSPQAGTSPPQAGAQPAAPGDSTNGMGSASPLSSATFGGNLPIIGVASGDKKDSTIREFNHKKKYTEWYFIYDPSMDRGGLITTPYQPQLQMFGQQNANGQNGSSFGNGTGMQPGMQNNPTQPQSGSFGTPSQPSNPPQQQ